VVYYFLLFWHDGRPQSGAGLPIFAGSSVLTAVVPILLAGVCGLLFGSSILDASEVRTAGQAATRGLLVASLAYLLLFTGSAVILAFNNSDLVGTVVLCGILFLYGLLVVGWLVAGAGAAAGWLLYLYRVKPVAGRKKV
jgi:hypothetical protein